MKVTIFDNYHAGVSLLSEPEQDAFYGAVMRYAFEGEEPDFDGIAEAVWATIKPLIDKSLKGQQDGAKGGNGRGNKNPPENPSETPPKTHLENPPGKPSGKRGSENQRKEKNEGKGKENPEGFFTLPAPSVDAAAAKAASTDDTKVPCCPLCSKRLTFDASSLKWRCGMCGEVKEPEYLPARKAAP